MIWLYVILGVVGAILIFAVLPFVVVANILYTILFVRTNKEKWGRGLSWDDPEQQRMFDEGKEWGEENEKYRESVEITNDGFHLVGEYFNFGFDRAVIIISGRMESGTYAYYFSEPFKQAGFNVLAIDNRSHGLSDGKYNCIGLKEYRDILAWSRFLHDQKSIKGVLIYGLCIGSATGLYAILDEFAPSYMLGLVADGMYIHFNESFNNHLIEKNKPIFPLSFLVMGMVGLVAGKNPKKHCPLKLMPKMTKPILFIYSKEDTYSVPKYGQLLYDICPSEKKRLVWFDHGVHSHVRINAQEKYDETIKTFIKDCIDG